MWPGPSNRYPARYQVGHAEYEQLKCQLCGVRIECWLSKILPLHGRTVAEDQERISNERNEARCSSCSEKKSVTEAVPVGKTTGGRVVRVR